MNKGGKPLVGLSACLLGENVRYDGGNKRDLNILETLGKLVDFIAVCPEVESGMGTPREPMWLVRRDGSSRLLTQQTGRDLTRQMEIWMQQKLPSLDRLPLCGYIFKARSPSCGLRNASCHHPDGGTVTNEPGLFAKTIRERFPVLPVADEEELHNPETCEEFISGVFNIHRQIR
jgi:uncharacterized protein YbbK (DUF523 family)